jgi:hypothetical protein
VLGRIVDIGAELFAMTAAVTQAQAADHESGEGGHGTKGAATLADAYCRAARRRIAARFRALFRNDDAANYAVAQRVLKGEFAWMEEGIVSLEPYREARAAVAAAGTDEPEPLGEPVSAG